MFCLERFRKDEQITFYTGQHLRDGILIFSRHTYSLAYKSEYVDGFYGAGEFTIDRILYERSVGAVINSCEEDSTRSYPDWNVTLLWDQAFLDDSNVIRIPIVAKRNIEPGEELKYYYNVNGGCGAPFRAPQGILSHSFSLVIL